MDLAELTALLTPEGLRLLDGLPAVESAEDVTRAVSRLRAAGHSPDLVSRGRHPGAPARARSPEVRRIRRAHALHHGRARAVDPPVDRGAARGAVPRRRHDLGRRPRLRDRRRRPRLRRARAASRGRRRRRGHRGDRRLQPRAVRGCRHRAPRDGRGGRAAGCGRCRGRGIRFSDGRCVLARSGAADGGAQRDVADAPRGLVAGAGLGVRPRPARAGRGEARAGAGSRPDSRRRRGAVGQRGRVDDRARALVGRARAGRRAPGGAGRARRHRGGADGGSGCRGRAGPRSSGPLCTSRMAR